MADNSKPIEKRAEILYMDRLVEELNKLGASMHITSRGITVVDYSEYSAISGYKNHGDIHDPDYESTRIVIELYHNWLPSSKTEYSLNYSFLVGDNPISRKIRDIVLEKKFGDYAKRYSKGIVNENVPHQKTIAGELHNTLKLIRRLEEKSEENERKIDKLRRDTEREIGLLTREATKNLENMVVET